MNDLSHLVATAPHFDDGDRGLSLAHHDFTDLFISRDPEFLNSARGLRKNVDDINHTSRQISALPPGLQEDAEHLLKRVEEVFSDEGKPEFVLGYDGIIYRCALISGALGNGSAARHWCLRQVGSKLPDLTGLSLATDTVVSLRKAGNHRGLVVVSGFFGSGKSSTAAATLVDWVKTHQQSAVTFEDPPEFPISKSYEGGGIIHQVPYKEGDLSQLVARSKRWAPRYVMFGEIRDSITAVEALQTSVTGPMVICTIHAIDLIQALATIARYASKHMPADEARQMLGASLRLILHQDLVAGRPVVRKFSLMQQDSSAIRNKIENGKFSSLRDDLGDAEGGGSNGIRHL